MDFTKPAVKNVREVQAGCIDNPEIGLRDDARIEDGALVVPKDAFAEIYGLRQLFDYKIATHGLLATLLSLPARFEVATHGWRRTLASRAGSRVAYQTFAKDSYAYRFAVNSHYFARVWNFWNPADKQVENSGKQFFAKGAEIGSYLGSKLAMLTSGTIGMGTALINNIRDYFKNPLIRGALLALLLAPLAVVNGAVGITFGAIRLTAALITGSLIAIVASPYILYKSLTKPPAKPQQEVVGDFLKSGRFGMIESNEAEPAEDDAFKSFVYPRAKRTWSEKLSGLVPSFLKRGY